MYRISIGSNGCQSDMFATPTDLCSRSGKVFQDPVHGSIELHDLLVKIIDTTAFQRLRHLYQTGLTYFVYPGASHKRFEHSIGVCHLSGIMLDALERNSPEEMKSVTTEEKLCVLIAGLCHDLGHGPFSHTWEVFTALAGKEFEHEDMSKKIFEHMLNERNGELRKEFQKFGLGRKHVGLILELIDGRGETLEEPKKFLYEIVANKKTDIDVDKWDYFLRDGSALGIKVTFDYQRLLKFTKVENKNGEYSIVFRDKEKFSIEDMFRMRADLHIRAYQHHAVKKIEAMFLDAMLAADPYFEFEANGKKLHLSEAHSDVQLYLRLDDCVMNEIKRSEDRKLVAAKEILERIDRRELYYDVDIFYVRNYQLYNGYSPKPVPGRIWAQLIKDIWNECKIHIFPAQSLITSGKFLDPISNVRFYSKSPNNPRKAPTIRYDLPYSWIVIYSREKLTEEEKKRVGEFTLNWLRCEIKDATVNRNPKENSWS